VKVFTQDIHRGNSIPKTRQRLKRKSYFALSQEIIREMALFLACIFLPNYIAKILSMFDKHANLKYKFGNRHFWAEGYYVSTVGLNEATIRKYLQEQEKHDIALDKLSVKEYEDPFKGGK